MSLWYALLGVSVQVVSKLPPSAPCRKHMRLALRNAQPCRAQSHRWSRSYLLRSRSSLTGTGCVSGLICKTTVTGAPPLLGHYGKACKAGDSFRPRPTSLHVSRGDEATVARAIDGALAAKATWEALPWGDRAAIFLKAADLISKKYRYKLLAATILGQGKNAWQAEIDAAAEVSFSFI
jgi:hypothetical protein